MNDERKHTRAGSLFGGVALIAVGTLFLLDEIGIADFGHVIRSYWPLFVVGVGVMRLIDGEIWDGLWLLAVGGWMQLVTLGMFGLTWGSSWPLLLIILGAGMVARALFAAVRPRREEQGHESR